MSAITNPAVKEVRGYIRELSADERARQLAEARAKALRDEASLLEDAEKRSEVKGEALPTNTLAVAVKKSTGDLRGGGVMINIQDRQHAVQLIADACKDSSTLTAACDVVGISIHFDSL